MVPFAINLCHIIDLIKLKFDYESVFVFHKLYITSYNDWSRSQG